MSPPFDKSVLQVAQLLEVGAPQSPQWVEAVISEFGDCFVSRKGGEAEQSCCELINQPSFEKGGSQLSLG
jgi:hypothetical protein